MALVIRERLGTPGRLLNADPLCGGGAYMDVRPEMHGRRVDRRLVAAAVVAIVVGLGWSLRNVVFYQYTRDFCDVTGSWRITMAYFGQFQSAKIAPSPLEAEAQRRDIAVRHHWQSVE